MEHDENMMETCFQPNSNFNSFWICCPNDHLPWQKNPHIPSGQITVLWLKSTCLLLQPPFLLLSLVKFHRWIHRRLPSGVRIPQTMRSMRPSWKELPARGNVSLVDYIWLLWNSMDCIIGIELVIDCTCWLLWMNSSTLLQCSEHFRICIIPIVRSWE